MADPAETAIHSADYGLASEAEATRVMRQAGFAYDRASGEYEAALIAGDEERRKIAHERFRVATDDYIEALRALVTARKVRVPPFEVLLADPTIQPDPEGMVLTSIPSAKGHVPDPFTQEFQLCDDDGIVRRGAMHHGTDYPCTSHAHFAGEHIRCTNPIHDAPPSTPTEAVHKDGNRAAPEGYAGGSTVG